MPHHCGCGQYPLESTHGARLISFSIPPPNESAAPRLGLATASYWLGLGSIWVCPLSLVSIVLGIIALNTIKASNGAYSGRYWAIQGIVISVFTIVMMSALIYLGGKYAWDWW